MPRLCSKFARLALLIPSALACGANARGQAVPVIIAPTPYEGFQLPTIGGSLRYSLTASEAIIFGYNGLPGNGANALTNLSGDLAYLSKSTRRPFSAVYSGGYLFGNSNEPSYVYQNLAVSQVFRTPKSDFVLADSISYLPQSPVGGLSGIPGTGDLNISPIQVGLTPGLGILTEYGSRVSNSASGTATRRLTAGTSVSGTGAYYLQRFLSSSSNPLNGGINNDQLTLSANVDHRLDGRNDIGATYSFGNATISNPVRSAANYGYETQTLAGTYSRRINSLTNLTVAAGPQRTSNSGSLAVVSAPSVNVFASASASYAGPVFSAGLNYSRGVSNGDGVVVGSRSDIVSLSGSRQLRRVINVSAAIGFNRSVQLQNSLLPGYNSNAVVASGQVGRQFRNKFSIFGSYTLQRQLFAGTANGITAFNGLSQVLSFGVTYSPSPLLGR